LSGKIGRYCFQTNYCDMAPFADVAFSTVGGGRTINCPDIVGE
jgi:hypothetical protein